MQKSTTKSFKQTKKLGENLAKQILKQNLSKTAIVLGLEGELGSGKTTFLQGFANGLGIKEKILSPTFILMRKFLIPNILQNRRPSELEYKYFYHFDCYRLNKPEEILQLGFKEIISNPKNIVAIEWPERIKKIMPKKLILIKFGHMGKEIREITIDNL